MRVVLQRVSRASVTVDHAVIGQIEHGFLALVGIGDGDGDEDVELMSDKVAHLRVFADEEGKMNRSLQDIGGALLAVSQFTLHADCRKGRRPSFVKAARPERATELFDAFVANLRARAIPVETGQFGAMMDVELVNSGPVTIFLDTDVLKRGRKE